MSAEAAARDLLRAATKVLRSPPSDRRRALEATAELTRASLEIRLLPRKRTVRLLGAVRPGDTEEHAGPDALREATRVGDTAALVAARLPWHPTCLRQALAVQRMLRRRAIPSRLHLGVTSPTEATAHAWVTVDGQAVVGGSGVERVVQLAAFG
jgi:Transglutaminase-like superfamily